MWQSESIVLFLLFLLFCCALKAVRALNFQDAQKKKEHGLAKKESFFHKGRFQKDKEITGKKKVKLDPKTKPDSTNQTTQKKKVS
jgi:hypothetical protein